MFGECLSVNVKLKQRIREEYQILLPENTNIQRLPVPK